MSYKLPPGVSERNHDYQQDFKMTNHRYESAAFAAGISILGALVCLLITLIMQLCR